MCGPSPRLNVELEEGGLTVTSPNIVEPSSDQNGQAWSTLEEIVEEPASASIAKPGLVQGRAIRLYATP